MGHTLVTYCRGGNLLYHEKKELVYNSQLRSWFFFSKYWLIIEETGSDVARRLLSWRQLFRWNMIGSSIFLNTHTTIVLLLEKCCKETDVLLTLMTLVFSINHPCITRQKKNQGAFLLFRLYRIRANIVCTYIVFN